MLIANECYSMMVLEAAPARSQLALNQFIDDFRRAGDDQRRNAIKKPIEAVDATAALLAASVEVLCVESVLVPPDWVRDKVSPEPFFAFGAKSFALRVRLMLESPPAFKMRRVFVPENFLSRA